MHVDWEEIDEENQSGESVLRNPISQRMHFGVAEVLVLVLFLLLYLPFANKAFHIDDNVFVDLSRMIGWNPLNATPTDYNYNGTTIPKLIPYEITHPILVPYLIKIATTLFGAKERALHLVFVIFPLIAVFSLMKLNEILFPDSRRPALLLALFFCSIPAFLVNSQNIMTDVPTLAFLLLAMTGFMCGIEKGSRGMTYLGSLALTIAIFTSYQMVIFAPLIFLYALLTRKLTARIVAALAFPIVVLSAWLIAVYALYDVIPVLKTKMKEAPPIAEQIMTGLGVKTITKKIFSIIAFIGAAMIWVVPMHYILKGKLWRFFLILAPLVVVSALTSFKLFGFGFSQTLIFSIFVSLGLLTVITLMHEVWLKIKKGCSYRRELFLLCWFLTVICYVIAFFPFSAARYLLPAFAPILMLLFNDPAWNVLTQARKAAVLCVLGCSLLFALASAFSDYKLADTYRDYAEKVKAFRASRGNTFDVWYIGQWGMQYYMDKAGARYLRADSNEPIQGDYLVVPETARLWIPSIQLERRLTFFAEQRYSSWLPLRIFNKRCNAGFYCHDWGMLPFAFSHEPDEEYLFLKVVR